MDKELESKELESKALDILKGENINENENENDKSIDTDNDGSNEDINNGSDSINKDESKTDLYSKLIDLEKKNRRLERENKEFKNKKYVDYKEIARQDPIKALKELGISDDNIIDSMLDLKKKPDENQIFNEKIAKLEKQLEKYEIQQKNQMAENDKNNVISFFDDLSKKNNEKWHYFNAMKKKGSLELALETSKNMYHMSGGEVPTGESVLDAVEKYYIEQANEFIELNKNRNKSNKDTNDVKNVKKDVGSDINEASKNNKLTDEELFELAKRELLK